MADKIRYSVQIKGGIKKWGLGWTNSLAYLCKPEAMNTLAKGYRYYINQYVPKDTGDLRKSARAKYKVNGEAKAGGGGSGSATVYWGMSKKTEKYAHYQFVGDVYGPNKAVFNGQGPNITGVAGTHSGWRSPTAHGKWTKENMGWKMGNPGYYTLKTGQKVVINGYTTPNTGWDWIKRFKDDNGDNGEKAVNIRAGRLMYEMFCIYSKKQKLRGGRHIYNQWRQIAGRID